MATTALLLVNPGARRAGGTHDEIAQKLRDRGLELTTLTLDHPGSVQRHLAEHASVDRVIVGGGDGTVSTVAAALAGTGVPLGIIPLGTANNVARTLAIPDDLDAACDIAAGNSRRQIDVGEVNDRRFLTTASFGLSVAITESLRVETKQRWGSLAYVLTAIGAVRKARPVRATIRWPAGELKTRTVQVVVGNGKYYGSALQVADDAAIDDHALDLFTIEVRHWWHLLTLGPSLRRGSHARRRAVTAVRAQSFEIHTGVPVAIDVDGEIATHTPATFRVVPQALCVLAPQDESTET